MDNERFAACFKIRTRCLNCRKDAAHVLSVPAEEDAPTSVDELLESAFLQRQVFTCQKCESQIAIVTAVSKVKEAEHA